MWGGNRHEIMLVYIDYAEIVAVWKANLVSKIKLKLKVINNRLQKSGLLVIKSEAWICSNNLLYVSCFYGLDLVREFYMICFSLDHICSGISAHWYSQTDPRMFCINWSVNLEECDTLRGGINSKAKNHPDQHEPSATDAN